MYTKDDQVNSQGYVNILLHTITSYICCTLNGFIIMPTKNKQS